MKSKSDNQSYLLLLNSLIDEESGPQGSLLGDLYDS